MQKELEAGSSKVIAEARESGTVGVFRKDGEVRSDLIEEILTKIPSEKIFVGSPYERSTSLVYKTYWSQCKSRKY